MPELPEVETIARGLAKRIIGEVVDSVWLGQKKEPLKSPASAIAATLEHSRIAGVRRIGKHIVFDLDRADLNRVAPVPTKGQADRNLKRTAAARRRESSITRAEAQVEIRPAQGKAQW